MGRKREHKGEFAFRAREKKPGWCKPDRPNKMGWPRTGRGTNGWGKLYAETLRGKPPE